MMVVRIIRPRMRDVNITITRSRSDLSSSMRLEVRFTEVFIITFGSPGVSAGLFKLNWVKKTFINSYELQDRWSVEIQKTE